MLRFWEESRLTFCVEHASGQLNCSFCKNKDLIVLVCQGRRMKKHSPFVFENESTAEQASAVKLSGRNKKGGNMKTTMQWTRDQTHHQRPPAPISESSGSRQSCVIWQKWTEILALTLKGEMMHQSEAELLFNPLSRLARFFSHSIVMWHWPSLSTDVQTRTKPFLHEGFNSTEVSCFHHMLESTKRNDHPLAINSINVLHYAGV